MRTYQFYMLMLALGIIFGAIVGKAYGHHFYSVACCDDGDCFPLKPGEVRFVKEGYLVMPQNFLKTPVLVPHGSSKIKASPDGNFHSCTPPKSPNWVVCLYVPFSTWRHHNETS